MDTTSSKVLESIMKLNQCNYEHAIGGTGCGGTDAYLHAGAIVYIIVKLTPRKNV
jgi:hypothetical protein